MLPQLPGSAIALGGNFLGSKQHGSLQVMLKLEGSKVSS